MQWKLEYSWSKYRHGSLPLIPKAFQNNAPFPTLPLAFVHQVGAIAESEGHHPDITLGWGKVGITLTTHAIGGLSQNDCIVAAKIDAIA
jgi:pterin-4a-carbinolamine dehydratase